MNNDYRILVVDDEEDLCEILKFNLEMEGYAVDTANSAEEALKLDLAQYSLLLLDVMMGEISGFKMASMLKRTRTRKTYPSYSSPPKTRKTTRSPDSTWARTTTYPNRFHCARS